MKSILAGTLLVVSSFVTTNVWAADGGGGPSPEQPIDQGWERQTDISALPSTYIGDASGFVIDAVRGGVFEGTLAYDRTTRQYDYADNVWGTGGVLPASEVDEAVMGTGGAYQASKKPGGMCKGKWTLPCILIPVIIDEMSDGGGEQPPPPDIEERAIDTAAALCIAQKNIAVKAAMQTANQCIASGGSAVVDYGDACGIGAGASCTQDGGGEGPGEPGV